MHATLTALVCLACSVSLRAQDLDVPGADEFAHRGSRRVRYPLDEPGVNTRSMTRKRPSQLYV